MPTLSPFFLCGYIDSYLFMLLGQTASVYELGSRLSCPAGFDYREWRQPMDSYLRPAPVPPHQPIDYSLTRIMFRGLSSVYQEQDTLIQKRSFEIGHVWWRGVPIFSAFEGAYALQRVCMPLIWKTVAERQPPAHSGYQRACAAIDTFVSFLQGAGSIPMTVAYHGNTVQLTLAACPFCDQSPNCKIVHGMIQGLLDTLHMRKLKDTREDRGDLFFAAEQPDPHHIVLQFADALMRRHARQIR